MDTRDTRERQSSQKPVIRSTRLSRYLILVLVGAAILTALFVLSRYNYLLFHSLAEIFSIVIAFSIFVIAWNTRRMADTSYLLFIGIAYLFVGGIDLVHTLAFTGMGVFPGVDTNPATQLWISARYMESISLLTAILFIRRRFNTGVVFSSYALVVVMVLISIFYWENFPQAFVEGVGLTPFKVISEYIICFILVGAIILLLKNRRAFSTDVVKLLVAAMVVSIATEMAFTLYTDAYGVANMIGHLLKIISFYLIYKALIEIGLNRPFDLLFRDLKQSETGLARHTAELETANRELESFSYMVSHDLQAPLRSLEGFSLAVLEEYGDDLDETGKEYLRNIGSSSQLMSSLIKDILTLSRVVSTPLDRDEIDLSQLAREVVAEIEGTLTGKEIKFRIQPGVTGEGDRSLLKVVLENLIGNACKFSSKSPSPFIEFGVQNHTGERVYFVKDNGAGFDMALVDKLFKPFQRLHSTQDFPGTGIGLASVQRIISRHGGRIWAAAEPGKGATFYFTLDHIQGLQ